MAMLEVRDLNVYYGSIHAVKGVSFEVEEGEIVTLIGANGTGKSTTLNTVAGLLKPRGGTIEFEGESLVGVPAHKMVSRGMALCPEGRRVFRWSTSASRASRNAATSVRAPSRAASSRCWPWAARS